MPARVMILGANPSQVDFSDLSVPEGMNAEKVMAGLNGSADELRRQGYDADVFLVDLSETAAHALSSELREKLYECIVVGAGLRIVPEHTELFETLINVLRADAPNARLAFNLDPGDSADAALRQLGRATT